MVAEIYSGKPVQRRCRLCDSHELPTWVASGHLGGFSDPDGLQGCKERFRADKLIEDYMAEHNIEIEGSVDGWSQEADETVH